VDDGWIVELDGVMVRSTRRFACHWFKEPVYESGKGWDLERAKSKPLQEGAKFMDGKMNM